MPLDRIVHAEVWATEDIPAELPPMVNFKAKADTIIKERWGFEVEHVFATKREQKEDGCSHLSYSDLLYTPRSRGKFTGRITGFPMQISSWCKKLKYEKIDIPRYILQTAQERERERETICGFPTFGCRWCTGELKKAALWIPSDTRQLVQRTQASMFSSKPHAQGAGTNIVQYLGIAADEPERIKRHGVPGKELPLVMIGWTEAQCREWCIENDLLSPIYTDTCLRGGCWFCHNQSVQSLRELRHNYPDYWKLLLKWDSDSPVTFHPDGHTVHDFDRRFALEDTGEIDITKKFLWKMIK